jgi:hypothetical protein
MPAEGSPRWSPGGPSGGTAQRFHRGSNPGVSNRVCRKWIVHPERSKLGVHPDLHLLVHPGIQTVSPPAMVHPGSPIADSTRGGPPGVAPGDLHEGVCSGKSTRDVHQGVRPRVSTCTAHSRYEFGVYTPGVHPREYTRTCRAGGGGFHPRSSTRWFSSGVLPGGSTLGCKKELHQEGSTRVVRPFRSRRGVYPAWPTCRVHPG